MVNSCDVCKHNNVCKFKKDFEKLKAETTNQIITSYVNQNESLEAMAI